MEEIKRAEVKKARKKTKKMAKLDTQSFPDRDIYY